MAGGVDDTVAAEPSRASDTDTLAPAPDARPLAEDATMAASVDRITGDDATLSATPAPATTDPSVRLRAGEHLGRYVILDELGAGGMGVVYAAYDPELDRRVALKLLHRAAGGEGTRSEHAERLLAEARTMARLSHPNVISVFDAGKHGDRVFLAMEYVEGRTLTAWLEEKRDMDEIVAVFMAAGEGLAAAHEAGIVHRDFKPDNVMLDGEGRVRVMDFGIARGGDVPTLSEHELAVTGNDRRDSLSLTRTGALMGTPAYMAPEQFGGAAVDARADQFSFCVALFEALAGERPFQADTLHELIYAVVNGKRIECDAAKQWPRRIRAVLDRGLAAEPDQRFSSMRTLLDELRPREKRRRWIWPTAIVIASGAIAGAIVLRAPPPADPTADYCTDVDAPARETWNDERRAKIRTQFEREGGPLANEAFERVDRGLTNFTEAWSKLRVDGCTGARIRGSLTESLYEKQIACLAERLDAADALAHFLEDADGKAIERAALAVGSLPSLQACADEQMLLAAVPRAEDPEVRTRANEAGRMLIEAQTLEILGRYDEAEALAAEVTTLASSIDYPPLAAALAFRNGSLADYRGRYEEAIEVLENGYFAALRGRHDNQAVDTAAKLVHVYGDHLENYDQADRWARHGHALVDRGGITDGNRATLLNNEANPLIARTRLDEAEALLDEALKLRRRSMGEDAPSVAVTLSNLGRVYEAQERLDDAIEIQREAVALRRRSLGPRHPFVSDDLQALAKTQNKRGDRDGAIASMHEAKSICVDALGAHHPQCAWKSAILGNLLSDRDPRAAETALTEAVTDLEKAHGAEHSRTKAAMAWLEAIESPTDHP